MALGPVEYIAITCERNRFAGEIIPVLEELPG
jgi:hypothetical protein